MRLGKSFIGALAAFAAAGCFATAFAQGYPTRTVTLVVGFAPGGGVDTTARLLASKLSESLGRPVVVENRPGAGSNIAAERVAKAAPDGHTLLVTTPAVAINMALYDKLPFDTLRDLVPVTMISGTPNILVVNPSVHAGSVQELIALARARPGALNYSSAGVGTTPHLCGELFKLRTETDIVHVPYNGNAPSLAALIAGNAELGFAALPAVIQYLKAGRLRALASTGEKRSDLLPDVPTLQEAGVSGVRVTTWYGVFAPAGTPADIVDTLARAVIDAVQKTDFRQRLIDQGEEPVGSTPAAFGARVRNEIDQWTDLARRAGIRAN